MQPSAYLQHADYALFGLDTETTTIESVIRASGLIDGYLQRPEGLIHDPVENVMLASGTSIKETMRVPFSGNVVFSRTPVVLVTRIATWDGYRWSEIVSRSGEALDPESGLYTTPFNVFRCVNAQFEFIAGWPSYALLPYPIKQACANVIKSFEDNCDMSGNIKYQKAGDAEIERFKDTILDADTKAILGPYRRVAY